MRENEGNLMSDKPIAIVYLKNRNDPSSYYRLFQYICADKRCRIIDETSSLIYMWYYNGNGKYLGIKRCLMAIESIFRISLFITWDMLIWKTPIVIINRKIFARKSPIYGDWLLKKYLANKVVFWDFDDDIIYDREITSSEVKILENVSEQISVTNEVLKGTLAYFAQRKTVLLPTTDLAFLSWSMKSIMEKRLNVFKEKIRLIWVGTKNNISFLKNILPEVEKCGKSCIEILGKELELVIVSNEAIIANMENVSLIYVPWNREIALIELEKAHIGLMPLQENTYTKGKGGFKAIQYLGSGLPAIVSNVGFNTKVINGDNGILVEANGQWEAAILEIAKNEKIWQTYSENARNSWMKKFAPDLQIKYWQEKLSKKS